MYERIVCLTEETTETLYSIGEDWRIVGISGFTVRPPQARKEKPRVSAFTSAKIDEILQLRPDLVLGFSDIQADIAADLIRQGVEVHVFNHRSVSGHQRPLSISARPTSVRPTRRSSPTVWISSANHTWFTKRTTTNSRWPSSMTRRATSWRSCTRLARSDPAPWSLLVHWPEPSGSADTTRIPVNVPQHPCSDPI